MVSKTTLPHKVKLKATKVRLRFAKDASHIKLKKKMIIAIKGNYAPCPHDNLSKPYQIVTEFFKGIG